MMKKKAFSGVLGRCDETFISRSENANEHEDAKADGDVAALVGMSKKLSHRG